MRKLYYNITITRLSVMIALVIGTVELGGLFAEKLGGQRAFWQWVEAINLNELGFVIVGLFVLTWAVALADRHFGHIRGALGRRASLGKKLGNSRRSRPSAGPGSAFFPSAGSDVVRL